MAKLNLLNDRAVRSAQYPETKSLNDGSGLSLKLTKTRKFWNFRYTSPLTKRVTQTIIGDYRDVSLKKAREIASHYRMMIKMGQDPVKSGSDGKTFDDIAQKYFEVNRGAWTPKHFNTTLGRYNNYLKKPLGHIFIDKIDYHTAKRVLDAVSKAGSHPTAKKLSSIINGIMDQGVDDKLIDRNLCLGAFGKVKTNHKPKPMPHLILTESQGIARFSQFLNDIENLDKTSIEVKYALLLAPHLFMRTANLVSIKLEYYDKENSMLHIPSEDMKDKTRRFYLPLSKQAQAIIEEVIAVTNPTEYLFESRASKTGHITGEAVNKAKKRTGWDFDDLALHGLRHTATTYLSERGFDFEATEAALHHKLAGIRGIYNKAEYIHQRKEMMQYWSDFLDETRNKHAEKGVINSNNL